MKKYSLLVVTSLCFAACTSGEAGKNNDKKEAAATETAATEAPKKVLGKDPVCGMEREDNSWTEYVVKGTDTTWFCSPHCKETYEKNPEKYQGKPEEKKG